MKLFLIIAIIAVLAVVVIAMQRTGPRITKIDRHVDRDEEERGE
jgi:hypothetical protein